MSIKKVWLITFPTHQYKEDVKDLARKSNLVIIDSKFRKDINPELIEVNPPKITPLKVKPVTD